MSESTVSLHPVQLHPSDWSPPGGAPGHCFEVATKATTDDEPSAAVLSVVVSADGDDLTLRLRGELDGCTAPHLERVLADVVANARAGSVPRGCEVTIDVTRLTFLAAAGLTVLVEAHRDLAAIGADLRVTGAGGPTRRVLDLTGLLPRFCRDDRRRSALDAHAQRTQH